MYYECNCHCRLNSFKNTVKKTQTQTKKTTKPKSTHPSSHTKQYMCLAKCSGKQKLSTTKHWETEFVNMSKSIEATVFCGYQVNSFLIFRCPIQFLLCSNLI